MTILRGTTATAIIAIVLFLGIQGARAAATPAQVTGLGALLSLSNVQPGGVSAVVTGPSDISLSNASSTFALPTALGLGDADTHLRATLFVKYANADLSVGPYSVTYDGIQPDGTDPHDYIATSVYAWPNATSSDGLPWVVIDGKYNPDLGADNTALANFAKAIRELSVGYYITGSESYAQKATSLLNTWFIDPATYMRPSAPYSQMVPGKPDTVFDVAGFDDRLVPLIASIDLLKGSVSWPTVSAGMQSWETSFINWMKTAPEPLTQAGYKNNHGTKYYHLLAYLQYDTGDLDGAKQTLTTYFTGIFNGQIDANGVQVLEVSRADAYHYSEYALDATLENYMLAKKLGLQSVVDDPSIAAGAKIQKALEFLVPYVTKQQPWPYSTSNLDSTDNDYYGLFLEAQETFNSPLINQAATYLRAARSSSVADLYDNSALLDNLTNPSVGPSADPFDPLSLAVGKAEYLGMTKASNLTFSGTGQGTATISYLGSDGQTLNHLDITVVGSTVPYLGTSGDDAIMLTNSGIAASGLDGNDIIIGSDGNNTLDGGSGDDLLSGGAGNDILLGGDGNDLLYGGAGDDSIDGGIGTDTVSYEDSPVGVKVYLALTTPQVTNEGTDTLTNIENIIGSAFSDTLEGNSGDNVIDGKGGTDAVTYQHATAGVTVNLGLTTPQNTVGAGTDTILNIEKVTGSNYNDLLMGNSGDNIIDGGNGIDTVSYASSTAAVTVSLAATTTQATGGAGNDTLRNVENLTGSSFDDFLSGNSGDNILDGGAGNDTVDYSSSTAAVTVALGLTTKQATGGAGNDTVLNFERLYVQASTIR